MKFFTEGIDYPVGNGGGTCKTIEDLERFIKTDIPMIEIGSITQKPRLGNEGNTFYSGNGFTLNSLGLPNPGYDYYKENLPLMVEKAHLAGKKAMVNVAGFNKEEFNSLTKLSFSSGADYTVMNCGCPNVWAGKVQKDILTYNFDCFNETIVYVLLNNKDAASKGKIGIKLSAILDPLYLSRIVNFLNKLVEVPVQSGFCYVGFVIAINTIANCYDENSEGSSVINPNGGLAGMAGKAILPIAIGQVRQLRNQLNPIIRIIGIGGITKGVDVQKMINAGADFVQVVSAYYNNEDLSIYSNIGAEYVMLST